MLTWGKEGVCEGEPLGAHLLQQLPSANCGTGVGCAVAGWVMGLSMFCVYGAGVCVCLAPHSGARPLSARGLISGAIGDVCTRRRVPPPAGKLRRQPTLN